MSGWNIGLEREGWQQREPAARRQSPGTLAFSTTATCLSLQMLSCWRGVGLDCCLHSFPSSYQTQAEDNKRSAQRSNHTPVRPEGSKVSHLGVKGVFNLAFTFTQV